MRILMLVNYHKPETAASSYLGENRREAFAKAGYEMVLYAPVPTRGVSDEVRQEYMSRLYEEEYDGRLKVHRFPLMRETRNPLQRAFRYFLSICNLYRFALREKNVDVLFIGSTPPINGLMFPGIKKKLGCKIVYSLQDIFPDSLVNANMAKKGSLLWKIGRKIENLTYRNADRIVVISEDFKRNIMKKGVPEEKIVIIPNWVDTDAVYPVDRENNVLFSRYGLDLEKYYICYSGNIGHSQNLRLLLDAAKALKEDLPDLRFVLIGEGAAKVDLEEMIHTESIDNVILLPFQPYEDIAHVFSLGDADIVISKPGIGGSSVPSKTWSIMAAERPVLASFDADSALAKLINEQNCGIVANAGELDSLVAAIHQLYKDKEFGIDLGKRGRTYVVENLSKEKCTGMYVSTIQNAYHGGAK